MVNMSQVYQVEGMSCGGCSSALEQAIKQVVADENVQVDLETGYVTVETISADKMAEIVDDCGFTFVGVVA